jgi:hypothetical protein
VNFIIMQVSPRSVFLPFRSKYPTYIHTYIHTYIQESYN